MKNVNLSCYKGGLNGLKYLFQPKLFYDSKDYVMKYL